MILLTTLFLLDLAATWAGLFLLHQYTYTVLALWLGVAFMVIVWLVFFFPLLYVVAGTV